MVVKAVNDSIGPGGLIPTLLVYEAISQFEISNEQPSASICKQAAAVRKATEKMSKHFARCQLNGTVNTRNGPNALEIHSAPINSHALLYWVDKHR